MESIHFALVTPQKVLFEEDVSWIQVPATDGYMGFLPNHAPFAAIAGPGLITCRDLSEKNVLFSVSGGYFEIHLNEMVFLADTAERADEIDVERAEKSMKRAQKRLEDADRFDQKRAQASLRRALTRIKAFESLNR